MQKTKATESGMRRYRMSMGSSDEKGERQMG
jgi:hypothetical protein